MERGHLSSQPALLKDYCDGSVCKSHPLFTVHRNGLQIMLYYDDIELCNPLGSRRTEHKVGMFILANSSRLKSCCVLFVFRIVLLQSWQFASKVKIEAEEYSVI